jgi:GDP-4-dehydro-6-deoxy-D-mannose reductase
MPGNPERVLVTGANGFVGRHLVPALRERFEGADVIGADHAGHDSNGVRALDITDADTVERLIAEVRPDAVVHLAALSSVGASLTHPRATWRTNVMGTLELVTALQRHAPGCHLLYVSSAEVYGWSAGAPVDEDAPLHPANPYAASKAAAEILVREAAGRGLFATIVRPFNHTGPGQDDRFVIPAFCRQIADIERGEKPPELLVGELNDERDFTDVGDIIGLYLRILAAGRGLPSKLVVNACSGKARRIGDMLQALLSMSKLEISVRTDPQRLRGGRTSRIVGDPSLALELLGWKAARPFDRTLEETLAYWRAPH